MSAFPLILSSCEHAYKPLMDESVKFYASPGDHDDPNERFYMNGQRNYTLKKGDVEFFA